MGPLRGGDAKVAEARLDDDARTCDLIPGHQDPQPRIRAAPPADSEQEIGLPRPRKLAVEAGDLGRGGSRHRSVEAMEVDDHDVPDRVDHSVAHDEIAAAKKGVARSLRDL